MNCGGQINRGIVVKKTTGGCSVKWDGTYNEYYRDPAYFTQDEVRAFFFPEKK